MKCFSCQRELEVGDQYIEDTASGFIGRGATPGVDGIIADLFGGQGDKIVFCDDCTTPGGKYKFETFYGDEDDAEESESAEATNDDWWPDGIAR